MQKILEKMGFSTEEIDQVSPEIEKFLTCEKELRTIRKDIAAIKVSLILIVGMTAFSLVS